MSASVFQLSAENITSYLKHSGWQLVNQNERCFVFEGYEDAVGKPFEIVLPINESAPDYPVYVEHTFRILSALTDKAPEALAAEVKLYDHDFFIIDVDARSVNDAAKHIPRIKGIIGYSANSERNLKPYFSSQFNRAGKRMLNHFEFSHKHNGRASYLVTSKVGEVMPYQRVLIQDRPDPGKALPLERRVMERIATGFINLEKAKSKRDVQPLIDGFVDGFNANMCDAVLKMFEQSAAPHQYSIQWSKNLPTSQGLKVVKNFLVERNHIQYLRMASDKLKERIPQLQQIRGRVIGLSSLVDPQSEEVYDDERSIIVLWSHGRGRPRKLRINLGKKDYFKAIKAHSDWSTISVEGEAIQRRAGWELADPHDFRVIR